MVLVLESYFTDRIFKKKYTKSKWIRSEEGLSVNEVKVIFTNAYGEKIEETVTDENGMNRSHLIDAEQH